MRRACSRAPGPVTRSPTCLTHCPAGLPPTRRAERTVRDVTVRGLDHVQVAAPPGCEAEARRFYGGLLGLAEVGKPAPLRSRGGAWFALGDGGQQLHVGVEEDFAPARKAHPALAVDDGALDALAERLVGAGVEVRWDDALPGTRRFYADDPWGNRLELVAAGATAGAAASSR
jgi:catechol 2,3-dioxygenase-like lactoylglutathione lyase family enzyme